MNSTHAFTWRCPKGTHEGGEALNYSNKLRLSVHDNETSPYKHIPTSKLGNATTTSGDMCKLKVHFDAINAILLNAVKQRQIIAALHGPLKKRI